MRNEAQEDNFLGDDSDEDESSEKKDAGAQKLKTFFGANDEK